MSNRDALGWRPLTAVAAGGLLGTALRLGGDLVIHQPVSTLVINVVGSLVLGYLTARLWPTASGWLKAGLGPGLLGSFTTFSALAVILADLGFTVEGALYLGATLVLGLGAAFAGLRLGARS